MTFAATILTLYPEMFPGPLGFSLAGRARGEGLWSLDAVQIRDFAEDRHRTVDDTPAGGGAGMVLKADILALRGDRHDAEAQAIGNYVLMREHVTRGPATDGSALVEPFDVIAVYSFEGDLCSRVEFIR